MNSSEDPFFRSPIASPDGTLQAFPVPANLGVVRGDWSTAPKIVKNWAFQLAVLGAVLLPIAIGLAGFGMAMGGVMTGGKSSAFLTGNLAGLAILWLGDLWLVWAIKKGVPMAWIVQIVISVLSLFRLGIPTLLHGYLLSQWFKPEVKTWFGRD